MVSVTGIKSGSWKSTQETEIKNLTRKTNMEGNHTTFLTINHFYGMLICLNTFMVKEAEHWIRKNMWINPEMKTAGLLPSELSGKSVLAF